jgi:hypothetical protein
MFVEEKKVSGGELRSKSILVSEVGLLIRGLQKIVVMR